MDKPEGAAQDGQTEAPARGTAPGTQAPAPSVAPTADLPRTVMPRLALTRCPHCGEALGLLAIPGPADPLPDE